MMRYKYKILFEGTDGDVATISQKAHKCVANLKSISAVMLETLSGGLKFAYIQCSLDP